MKVIVNNPVPAPLPPKTYDLVGLTWTEYLRIRVALLAADDRYGSDQQRREYRDLHDVITRGAAG